VIMQGNNGTEGPTMQFSTGQIITGQGRSERPYTGSYLYTTPDGTQHRIALQGAGKVFIAAATARTVPETIERAPGAPEREA